MKKIFFALIVTFFSAQMVTAQERKPAKNLRPNVMDLIMGKIRSYQPVYVLNNSVILPESYPLLIWKHIEAIEIVRGATEKDLALYGNSAKNGIVKIQYKSGIKLLKIESLLEQSKIKAVDQKLPVYLDNVLVSCPDSMLLDVDGVKKISVEDYLYGVENEKNRHINLVAIADAKPRFINSLAIPKMDFLSFFNQPITYVLNNSILLPESFHLLIKERIDSAHIIREATSNDFALYGNSGKDGIIKMHYKNEFKLLKVNTLLAQFKIKPADRKLPIYIDGLLVKHPDLLQLDADAIKTVFVVNSRMNGIVKETPHIDIVTVNANSRGAIIICAPSRATFMKNYAAL